MLATDSAPGAPSLLANSLWYKYMTSPDWAWKVWDNTIASLRQLPAMMSDVPSRRICALRYAAFLLHVDQHLPRGFDEQIRSWLMGSGRSEIAALTTETWDVVTVVPALTGCQKFADRLRETRSGFDDADWKVATKTTTNMI